MPETPASPLPGSDAERPGVRSITLGQPLSWLALAWHDLRRCPGLSLAHGAVIALFGAALAAAAHDHFWLIAGAFSGFLVVAPVVAAGLYALSRALERGEPANLARVLATWMPWRNSPSGGDASNWRLVRFGLLLALAGTGWVLTSAALITLLAPLPILNPMDFVRHVVLARDNYLFEIWLALGGVLAAPVFASSAIAMPLLVDRPAGVLQAVLTSWRAVLANPVPLALWAALIMGLTLLGLATLLVGLVVLVPLLGHASWHAYRALVLPQDGLPAERAP